MLSNADHDCLTQARRTIYQLVDFRDFPRQVIEATRTLVDNDVCGYAEVDTVNLHAATVSDNDAWFSQDLVDTWARHTLGPEILPYWRGFTPGTAIKFSDHVSLDELRDTQIYQAYYRAVDVMYQLVLPFCRDSNGVVLSLGFSRSGSTKRDFNERDRELVNAIARDLAQAHQNAVAYEQIKRGVAICPLTLSRTRTGLILITPHGSVTAATDLARMWVREYIGEFPAYSSRMPDDLWAWVRRSIEQQDIVRTPRVFRRAREEQPATLEVRLIGGLDDHGIALVFEHHEPLTRSEVSAALSITPAEVRVIRWLLHGNTSKEIAMILGDLSARTVSKHLEHVYDKLEVDSRSRAILRIAELLTRYAESAKD